MKARLSIYLVATFVVACLVAAVAACSDTATAAGITPPSGILVRSETLAAGKGCGTGPSQVFKFAAVVKNDDGATLGGATYDCFADGSFQNLPPSSNGSFHYTVKVFAYDKPTYDGSAAAIESASSDAARLAALPSTWTTTCDATEQANVEVFAVCGPLAPTTGPVAAGTVRIATDSFAAANDAGALTCGTAYTSVQAGDASDAGTDAASDAADDAASSSGPTVDCPAPLVFGGFTSETSFSTSVRLLFAGAPVGSTTCRAIAKPGVDVVASCDAVK